MGLRGIQRFAVEHIHGKLFHFAFIEMIEGEKFATGRPPHAVVHGKFLFIYPIHGAVDDFIFSAIGGNLRFGGGDQIIDVYVVFLHVSDVLIVWR